MHGHTGTHKGCQEAEGGGPVGRTLDWFLGEKQAAAWCVVSALGDEGCGPHEGGGGCGLQIGGFAYKRWDPAVSYL